MRLLGIVVKSGAWAGPEALPFPENYVNNEPCLSPDGKSVFFVATGLLSGEGEAEGLTKMARILQAYSQER